MSDVFYPTKELKDAASKPVASYIPEDGRDPDPAWDHISRSLWPSTLEGKTSRESLADILMYSCNDPTLAEASPTTAIVLARMCQRLMGDTWTNKWLWDNQIQLKKRTKYNRRNYGVGFFGKFWRKYW
jgi:hypothetical protein